MSEDQEFPPDSDATGSQDIRNTSEMSQGYTTYDITEEAQEALRRYLEDETRLRENLEREGLILPSNVLNLKVEIDGGAPLRIRLESDLIIGRKDPTTQHIPDIDLTDYGAYQMGISRQHAVMRILRQVPVLIDLGSRNGTYLNGNKLQANKPVPLRHGDEVRLGKIILRLFFSDENTED